MYDVLAYYAVGVEIADPKEEVRIHKEFLSKLDAKSRIYISENGINGQLSLSEKDSKTYQDWLLSREIFKDATIKIHKWHEHAFPKLVVKYRKQLVALDKPVDFSKKGVSLSPENFHKELEGKDPYILLDVRNDYEWALGHFEGAKLPPHDTFRGFSDWTNDLKKEVSKDTKVLMYCTGGIRCEFYSAYMKDAGFENIYQLDGGVIGYGQSQGSKKWKGKLFVFDDRLSVPISDEETEVIGTCHKCKKPSEMYYNCANIDCNKLFLCCDECIHTHKGTCGSDCESAPRVRPYEEKNAHKPFRKWYKYFDSKSPQNTE